MVDVEPVAADGAARAYAASAHAPPGKLCAKRPCECALDQAGQSEARRRAAAEFVHGQASPARSKQLVQGGDLVDEAKAHRGLSVPYGSAGQLRRDRQPSPVANIASEGVGDAADDFPGAGFGARLHREERVHHRLQRPRGVQALAHAMPRQQLVRVPAHQQRADRAHKAVAARVDAVAVDGHHVRGRRAVATNRGHHRLGVCCAQLAQCGVDALGLRRRASGAVDGQDHGANGGRLEGTAQGRNHVVGAGGRVNGDLAIDSNHTHRVRTWNPRGKLGESPRRQVHQRRQYENQNVQREPKGSGPAL